MAAVNIIIAVVLAVLLAVLVLVPRGGGVRAVGILPVVVHQVAVLATLVARLGGCSRGDAFHVRLGVKGEGEK